VSMFVNKKKRAKYSGAAVRIKSNGTLSTEEKKEVLRAAKNAKKHKGQPEKVKKQRDWRAESEQFRSACNPDSIPLTQKKSSVNKKDSTFNPYK
jgi:lipase chaperone LimK